MLQSLKTYEKSFAEWMLVRASFYLEGDPIFQTFKPVENEESIRNSIIAEICDNLNIPSASDNKQAVLDYLDDEIYRVTKLDEKTEKEALARLSAEGELPTDLYTVNIHGRFAKEPAAFSRKREDLIKETVKKPDMAYNFGSNYSVSIFAKYYREKYSHNNFFLLVVGQRENLVFHVAQAWRVYNDILSGNSFANALELLKLFVEKFGIEADLHGRTSKLFIDVIAKSKTDFHVKVDQNKLKVSKKGKSGFLTGHFLGPASEGDSTLSIFFAIDLEKYESYIKNRTLHKLK